MYIRFYVFYYINILCVPPLGGRITRYKPSVCSSVCLSRAHCQLENGNDTIFKLRAAVIHARNNWHSNFKVKGSKVKVTGATARKSFLAPSRKMYQFT